MANILYALTSISCAIVIEILLNRSFAFRQNDTSHRAFKKLLIVLFIFSMIDAFWGIAASGTFAWPPVVLYVLSFLFHAFATVSALYWLTYTYSYLGVRYTKLQIVACHLPLSFTLVLLLINFTTGDVFTVDSSGIYSTGPLRILLFLLQYLHFLFGAIRTTVQYFSEEDRFKKKRCGAVIVFSLVPIITGILQQLFPDMPFYSIGFMISALVIYVYNVTAEHEHLMALENQITRMISRENSDTLKALATIYQSMFLIDVEAKSAREISSNELVDSLPNREGSLEERFRRVIIDTTRPDHVNEMLQFTDIGTLDARLKGKTIISHEYLDRSTGWCRASFIRVNDNEGGSPVSVIYAVEVIDEEKRKVLEYQEALAKALQNENQIYGEMLQMQSNGIIATDMGNALLTMNDAAAKMFGYPSTASFDGDLSTLINKVEMDRKEETRQSYTALKAIGGRISFEFSLCNDGVNHIYIMATSKLATLQNGNKIIITSLTNITKSKRLEHELLHLSETDALTGIRNRGSGEKRIEQMVGNDVYGMFALLDVDKFKTINDNFGHGTGDKVLIAIAKALQKSFRGEDVVMRLGGDEFAVYAVGVQDEATAKVCIQRLFDEIDSISIPELKQGGRRITISLGAVFCNGQSDYRFDDLYQLADAAMYDSKKIDGNHYGISQ